MKIINHNSQAILLRAFVLLLLTGITQADLYSQMSVSMSTDVMTEIKGSVQVSLTGDWLNKGALVPGTSVIKLYGIQTQDLRQSGGAFHILTVDKTTGDVRLASDVSVESGLLDVQHGDVDLAGFRITLDPASAIGETPGNTVKGSAGYLTTTRALTAPGGENIASMGLAMSSPSDYGMTEIRRGHAAQQSNGMQSIQRYFDVIPASTPQPNAAFVFSYDDSELNGNSESDLALYISPDGGVNWIKSDGTLDAVFNTIEAADVPVVSRFTLSSHCLETCIATSAQAQAAIVYLNAAGLGDLSPETVNDGSRGACGIDSLKVSPDAFDCSDVGMHEVVLTVKDANGCEKTTTAMVEVIDNIAPNVHCRDITILVDEHCSTTITTADINDGTTDACGVSLSLDPTAATYDCEDAGAHLVVLTAMDPWGNMSACTATVTVLVATPDLACQDITVNLETSTVYPLEAVSVLNGDPADYPGYTFSVSPESLGCNQLGDNLVVLTATDPGGVVSTCEATVTVLGPDADCDGVADQCDVCDGGDDRQDSDLDGIPDCADWSGYADLPEEWKCASNANHKVFVCHEGNVLCINENAVQSHLDHGDFLGSCVASACTEEEALTEGTEAAHAPTHAMEQTSDASGQEQSGRQTGTVLAGNIPNPFSEETLIRFYLPDAGFAELSVYDLMGQRIQVIESRLFESGWHEVVFDGNRHPNGVYLCHLQTPDVSLTRPMIMQK